MNSIYPNPALGLVAYLPAACLVMVALPAGGPAGHDYGEAALTGY